MGPQAGQGLGSGGKGVADDVKEADPDGELDKHGAQAAQRADALLAIHLHHLLGYLLLIPGVFLLDLLHFGLHLAHGLGLLGLAQGQRECDHTHDYGEGDDGQAHVTEKGDIK